MANRCRPPSKCMTAGSVLFPAVMAWTMIMLSQRMRMDWRCHCGPYRATDSTIGSSSLMVIFFVTQARADYL